MAEERAAFLMTECNQEVFSFAAHFSRRVEASFTAGQVSSDGGVLLLRQADRKIGLLDRVASCFTDRRWPVFVQHQLSEMLAQRIYGLALGYEDLNDHEQLRHDPLMGVLAGRRKLEAPLAGKSTLNRLELPGGSKRYHKIDYVPEKIDALLVDVFIESHAQPPDRIVLDLDATDIPLYGHQPERFFHGYYDDYCYLPLYIFAGDQLLCARLRPSNVDGAAGALDEVKCIVTRLRAKWPKVRIVLRGDSGFCREELMAWCEADENRVDYLFGLARNSRLQKIVGKQMHEAKLEHAATGKAARVFTQFDYQTRKSWARPRRVVAKATVPVIKHYKGVCHIYVDKTADLAMAAYDEQWKSKQAVMDKTFSPQVPPLERLGNWCDYLYESQKEKAEKYGRVCGCPYASIGVELATQDDKIRAKAQELMARTAKYYESAIADAKREGLATIEDPKAAAQQVYSFALGTILQAKIQNDIEVLRHLAPMIMTMIGTRVEISV